MAESQRSGRPTISERFTKLKLLSKETRKAEKLVNIPDGYRGPGIMSEDGNSVPVEIRQDHGPKPDDSDERRQFSVELRMGTELNKRLEGTVPQELLQAKATDVENFLREEEARSYKAVKDLSNES